MYHTISNMNTNNTLYLQPGKDEFSTSAIPTTYHALSSMPSLSSFGISESGSTPSLSSAYSSSSLGSSSSPSPYNGSCFDLSPSSTTPAQTHSSDSLSSSSSSSSSCASLTPMTTTPSSFPTSSSFSIPALSSSGSCDSSSTSSPSSVSASLSSSSIPCQSTAIASTPCLTASSSSSTFSHLTNNNLTMPLSSTTSTSSYSFDFVSPEEFDGLMDTYLFSLHARKRSKALIDQSLANDCLLVLTNPDNTRIFNPKFRWWVRKHFIFTTLGEFRVLLDKKNGKPVCVKEKLYERIAYFHELIGHGGRDKTFNAISKAYSRVPAELVALFIKVCRGCAANRRQSKAKKSSAASLRRLSIASIGSVGSQGTMPSPLLTAGLDSDYSPIPSPMLPTPPSYQQHTFGYPYDHFHSHQQQQQITQMYQPSKMAQYQNATFSLDDSNAMNSFGMGRFTNVPSYYGAFQTANTTSTLPPTMPQQQQLNMYQDQMRSAQSFEYQLNALAICTSSSAMLYPQDNEYQSPPVTQAGLMLKTTDMNADQQAQQHMDLLDSVSCSTTPLFTEFPMAFPAGLSLTMPKVDANDHTQMLTLPSGIKMELE